MSAERGLDVFAVLPGVEAVEEGVTELRKREKIEGGDLDGEKGMSV